MLHKLFLTLLYAALAVVQVKSQVVGSQCSGNDLIQLFNEERTFAGAVTFCEDLGGGNKIARIVNFDERAIVAALRDNDRNGIWIGIDARAVGGNSNTSNFVYTDGTTENLDFIQGDLGVDPWGSGEPSGDGDCVQSRRIANIFNDVDCNSPNNQVLCRQDNSPACIQGGGDEEENGNGGGDGLVVIIGASVGAFVLVLLAVLALAASRRQKHRKLTELLENRKKVGQDRATSDAVRYVTVDHTETAATGSSSDWASEFQSVYTTNTKVEF